MASHQHLPSITSSSLPQPGAGAGPGHGSFPPSRHLWLSLTDKVTPPSPTSSHSSLLMVPGAPPAQRGPVSCHPPGTSDEGGFGGMCWGNSRCCCEQLSGCSTASNPHACHVPTSPAAPGLGQGRWTWLLLFWFLAVLLLLAFTLTNMGLWGRD